MIPGLPWMSPYLSIVQMKKILSSIMTFKWPLHQRSTGDALEKSKKQQYWPLTALVCLGEILITPFPEEILPFKLLKCWSYSAKSTWENVSREHWNIKGMSHCVQIKGSFEAIDLSAVYTSGVVWMCSARVDFKKAFDKRIQSRRRNCWYNGPYSIYFGEISIYCNLFPT